MTDGDALLAAILAEPDDDTARLVYADWLQEQGDEGRAEFIRVQCELARHPGMNCGSMYCSERGPEGLCDDCRRFKRLRRRERELFAPLAGQFRPVVPYSWAVLTHEPDRIDTPYSVVRRGFVGAVTCSAADWLAHADALLAAHPVTAVTLTSLPTRREYRDLFPRFFGDEDAHRRLLPRGNGRHNERWYAFRDNPDPARVLAALWPRVRAWNLPAPAAV